jgi:hypothetical protein
MPRMPSDHEWRRKTRERKTCKNRSGIWTFLPSWQNSIRQNHGPNPARLLLCQSQMPRAFLVFLHSHGPKPDSAQVGDGHMDGRAGACQLATTFLGPSWFPCPGGDSSCGGRVARCFSCPSCAHTLHWSCAILPSASAPWPGDPTIQRTARYLTLAASPLTLVPLLFCSFWRHHQCSSQLAR